MTESWTEWRKISDISNDINIMIYIIYYVSSLAIFTVHGDWVNFGAGESIAKPRRCASGGQWTTNDETYLRVTPVLGHGGVHFRRWWARDAAHRHTTAAVQVRADPRRLRRTVAHRKSATGKKTSGYNSGWMYEAAVSSHLAVRPTECR